MNKRPFQINLLRMFSMLGVVHEDRTYVYGPDFRIRILEASLNGSLHISRSWYREHLHNFNIQHYRGLHINVVKEETELIKALLLGKVKNPSSVFAQVEMEHIPKVMCRKCKGKGFIDWVDESVEPTWETECTQADLDFAYNKMLLSYIEFILPNNIFVYYRRRNLKNEYLKECKICPDCSSIGLSLEMLERYIPEPAVRNIRRLSSYHSDMENQGFRLRPSITDSNYIL